MPIQVVATYIRIPLPPVDLVTAGDDQFPICDVSITLTAEVDPIVNFNGHTVIWEQLTGDPIVLINADQLSASYLQVSGDVTDKIFRVTIDLNTAEEQTDEITVFASPTSVLSTLGLHSETLYGPPSAPVENMQVSADPQFPDPQNVIDANVPVTPFITLTWEQTSDTTLQPFIVDFDIYENDVFVATVLATDPFEYIANQATYFIKANYNVNQQLSSADNIKQDFTTVPIPNTIVVDDLMDNMSFAKSDVTLISFPNIVQTFFDISVNMGFGTSSIPFLERYSSKLESVVDASFVSSFGQGENIVIRTDPGGIGGG